MAQSKRRWFQFGLRTLFVVVRVAAATAAWVGYNLNWIWQRHEALAIHSRYCGFTPLQRGPGALGLFGEEGCESIIPWNEDAAEIERIERLFPESVVYSSAR